MDPDLSSPKISGKFIEIDSILSGLTGFSLVMFINRYY